MGGGWGWNFLELCNKVDLIPEVLFIAHTNQAVKFLWRSLLTGFTEKTTMKGDWGRASRETRAARPRIHRIRSSWRSAHVVNIRSHTQPNLEIERNRGRGRGL